jgi:hypothetical protein
LIISKTYIQPTGVRPTKLNLGLRGVDFKFSRELGRPVTLFGDIPPRYKIRETVLSFLNRFIEVVRCVTREYWIEPMRYQDFDQYAVSYWDGKRVYKGPLVGLDIGVGGVPISSAPPFSEHSPKMDEIRSILRPNNNG